MWLVEDDVVCGVIGWGWCGVWCDWLVLHDIPSPKRSCKRSVSKLNFNLQYSCFFLSILKFCSNHPHYPFHPHIHNFIQMISMLLFVNLFIFIWLLLMQIRISTLFLSLFLFRNLGFKANCHFTPVCGCICAGCVRHSLSWNRFFDTYFGQN